MADRCHRRQPVAELLPDLTTLLNLVAALMAIQWRSRRVIEAPALAPAG